MVVVQVTRVALLSQLGHWQLGEHLHIREDIEKGCLISGIVKTTKISHISKTLSILASLIVP